MTKDKTLQDLFQTRYGEAPALDETAPDPDLLNSMVARGSCRTFLDKPVPMEWANLLCATALASPTKSDLQQRDIILLHSPEIRARLAALVGTQTWVANAPMIAVFCGNNRRQRQVHHHHSIPFANDHLDAFFNATADAAIALGAFVTAAEAIGLGCCPISAVRNEAASVADLLALPDHVFPVAGLAFGFAAQPPEVSKRLPLHVTCHVDSYTDTKIEDIVTYDTTRATSQPYAAQRFPDTFEASETYGWSEDKVRQYSAPERDTFGTYIRSIGFKLD